MHIIKATVFDRRGKIVSTAVNSFIKTHPLQAKYACKCGEPYKQYLHAEVLAIIRAKGHGYKIHVERYNKKGEPVLAKPCPICMLAIKESGIKEISYTI
jgi:deoxycytidylate deaminase